MGNLFDGVYQFAFAFYDYRKIPDKLLDWLLKVSKEVYRKEYAVLFKFEHTKDKQWQKLLDFVNEIELGDDYNYICIQGMEIEDIGCLSTFDVHARVAIFHTDESDINADPNPTKAAMKLDHDHFDMRYKNRGV